MKEITYRPIGVVHSPFIEDVDILDGTPLLDIKPHVPESDVRTVERTGWLQTRAGQVHEISADERFGRKDGRH
jgi:hypothetical protein